MKNKTKAELISELEEAHQRIAKLEVQQIRQNEIEKKLKENDERYRLLAENAGDYIWVMELATMRISYASPSVERILGYTQEEALKIPLERRYPPRSLKKVREILEEELKKEEENGQNKIGMRAFLLEAYHKDGHLIWLETTARPIQRNEAGAPTAILGISRDITKRIKTQELLQESNEKLSTTLAEVEFRITPEQLYKSKEIILPYFSFALDKLPEEQRRIEDLEQIGRLKSYTRARENMMKPILR